MNRTVKTGQWQKEPSYGIIKETIGGIFMPREYSHIQKYEKEILKLKEKGLTRKEIGDKLGFTSDQIHNFICQYIYEKAKTTWSGYGFEEKRQPTEKLYCTRRR